MRKLKLLFAACALLLGASSANAQVTPENNGVYYIYNEASGLFLTRGEEWGTQAIARPVALPWKVSIADGKYTLRMYDLTVDNQTSGFGDNAYTDNGSPIPFTPSGNATDGFTLKNGNNFITCPATAGAVSLSTTPSVWKFLNQAQYNTVLSARTASQEAAVATSKGVVIPNGKTLAEIVNDADKWSATTTKEDAPTADTWAVTQFSSPDWRGAAANWGNYGGELFQVSKGHYTKTISGLTAGIYKVSVRSMKRVGSNGNCYTMGQAGFPVTDAYLKANGNIIPIKAWYENCTGNNAPNDPAAVVNLIGGYTTEGYVYVGNDGKLEMDLSSEAWYWGCWLVFNGISYTFYNNEVSDEEIATLVGTIPAEGTIPASVYSNLTTLKNTLESEKTIAAFNALSTAITSASGLVAPYATLTAEIAKAKALGMDAEVADAYADVTTAEESSANEKALKVAEYNFVTTEYPYAIELGFDSWTTKVNAVENHGQHWDGTGTSKYCEQKEGYWLDSWSCDYSQNLTLPAGSYVLKIAGRKSGDATTLAVTVKNGETTIGTIEDFPNGDQGKGIDTSGETNFGDGTYANENKGRGWQWRYVKFTLAKQTDVTIAVSGSASGKWNWMGFCNATVQADEQIAWVPMVVNAEYKWATFCAPFDVTIPEGVTAYTVDGVKDETERTLEMIAVNTTIPANTPVVLYSEKDVDETFTGNPNYDNEPKAGKLFGVYEEKMSFEDYPNDAIYLLSRPAGCTKVAFYPVDKEQTADGGYTAYNLQYKAFLNLSAGNEAYPAPLGARGFFFSTEDAEATAIESVEVLTDGDYDAIYNAAGIQVDALEKGLNIVVKDGKSYKIYVK